MHCRDTKGIDFVSIDLNKPVEPQGPFQLLVHKVTDELSDKNNAAAQNKVKLLEVVW